MESKIHQKSIKKNAILNFIKTFMGIVFPLISFPYASRILGTVGIGKVNYIVSIVNYFVIFSTLGIPTYAIREGARIRDNKEKLGKFCTEIFIINIISTCICLLIFLGVFFLPRFHSYKILLIIAGINIPLNTLGMSWLYQIIEDYKRITIQTILLQLISLCLLFILVKKPEDYNQYMFVYIFATVGSNVLFFIHSRKIVKLFGYKNYEIKAHLKPILIIFGVTVASTLYLNMDITMLGMMRGDQAVGIYSASTKLINIICNMISSISAVILARLSYYKAKGEKDKFDNLIKWTAHSISAFSIPCMFGAFLLSDELLLLLSGSDFIAGNISMKILCIKIVLSPINGFLAYQILIPMKKENVTFWATLSGCIANLILNWILIRCMSYDGAAIATVMSEMIVGIICIIKSKNDVDYKKIFKGVYQYIIASIIFVVVAYLYIGFIHNIILRIMIMVLVSSLIYSIVLLAVRNEMIIKIKNEIYLKIKRR